MKELFPGHFKESEKSLKDVWETSLFVFDANILLNLYRYSDTTRNEFLRILDKIKDRAWLPNKAAEEYLNNRLSVIGQQEKAYEDTERSIASLKRDLDNARQHPFVSAAVMAKINSVFDDLCDELKKNKSVHTTRISIDEIKDSIASIFENSVGLPYGQERLEQLVIEGEERYKQKIPPGFKDSSKDKDSEVFAEKCRKYGDLIVWTQVIDKAADSEKGVVLVTDDKKEDWWEKFKGKTVGPRPELVKEFQDRASQTFHMYQADRFLELARENLGEQVSEEIVEEIREVRRRDKLALRKMKEAELFSHRKIQRLHLEGEIAQARQKMMDCEKEMHLLEEKKHGLEAEKNSLNEYRNRMFHEDPNEHLVDNDLTDHYYQISNSYDEVSERLGVSEMKYHEFRHQMIALKQELAHNRSFSKREATDDPLDGHLL